MARALLVNKALNTPGLGIDHLGGEIEILTWGTFGGATVTLEAQSTDETWVPVFGVSWTEPFLRSFSAAPCRIRINVSGGTGHSISAEMLDA